MKHLWKETFGYELVFTMVLCCGLLISGCAGGSIKPLELIPDKIETKGHSDGSVGLLVDGGREKHVMGLPLISNEVFSQALQSALEKSNLFKEIRSDDQGDFRLEAFIFNVNQPLMGASVIVKVEIAWTLIEVATGHVMWKKSIETEETLPGSAALAFLKRVKMATEGATKKNIQKAFECLSEELEPKNKSASLKVFIFVG